MSLSSPTPPTGAVRSMISIFENQTVTVNSEPVNLVRRTQSLGSASQRPTVIQRTVEIIDLENIELTQIEQQILHLQNNVSNKYKTYSRENHIYYQNQILFILIDLANVETRNNQQTIDQKSELTEALKRLNKKLNAILPSSETSVVTKTKHDKVSSKVEVPVVTRTKHDKVSSKVEIHDDAVVATTAKYDKFGQKSNVFEEKWKVKTSRNEPVLERKEKREKVKVEDKVEDDENASAVSVRNLKQLFEKNTNSNEGKTEFGMTKISKTFITFNSSSDLKYVPYSQKNKSKTDEEFMRPEPVEKRNSFERSRIVEIEDAEFSSQQVEPSSDGEEKSSDMIPDTSEDPESDSSSDGSDSEEHTAKESLDDDQ